MTRLGLIAGAGELPMGVAAEAADRGVKVFAVGFKGFTDKVLEKRVHEMGWFRLGKLQDPISFFQAHNVDHVVMAGKIEKSNLLRPWNLRFDRRALKMIRASSDWRDDTVLAAISDEFLSEGIVIGEITPWAGKLMAPVGIMTKRSPTDKQWKDIGFGREMAQGIGGLDIGQTVVVKNAAVLVAEAIEGTDRAIRRVSDLSIRHAVVVKMAKPNQDMRFDVPGVGPSTIDSMVAARAKVLAIEAGKTIILDRDEMIRRAEKNKIVVVGVPSSGPVNQDV